MNRVTSKFVPVLVALVGMLVAGSTHAAVITVTYVSGQVSTTSNFTPATTSAVALTGANPTVNMSGGQFLRFGLNIAVTGNANPAAGGAWDQLNQDQNAGVALPANLGLAVINGKVTSSDAAGATLAPRSQTFNPGALAGRSSANFGSTVWANKDSGDVLGGQIGNVFTMFTGNGAWDYSSETAANYGLLGNNANPNGNWFTNLTYAASATPLTDVTLQPTLLKDIMNIWHNSSVGDASSGDPNTAPPTFTLDPLGAGDTIVQAPGLVVSFVPEPGTLGLASIAMLGLVARRRKN